jgi:diguanylate cyclase
MSSGPKNDDKWRGKYLDLLDEQERAQKRYQDSVDVLRRGLLQFSLELEGKAPSLDSAMADFRNLLRDEEWPSVQRRLEQFSKTFEQYETQKQQAQAQFVERLKLWEAEISEQPLQREEMRQLKKWRKNIKKRLDWENERHAILGEVVALGTHVLKFRRSPKEWAQQQSKTAV